MTVTPLEVAAPSVTGGWCAPFEPLYDLFGPSNRLEVLRVADARVTVSWKDQQRYPWTRKPISRHVLEPGGDWRLVLYDVTGVRVVVTVDGGDGLAAVHYGGRLYSGGVGWSMDVVGPERHDMLPTIRAPRGRIEFL